MAQADRAAIITGASSSIGIGAAIARRLAGLGWRLFLTADGPAEGLEAVAAECRALGAPAVATHLADLGEPAAPAAMVEAALLAHGRVDALVNNAGLRLNRPFGDFSAADFDRMMAVNLRAAFLASQAVLPAMRRQGGGRILHVASQFGSVASPGRALYGMTKAALIHLTRTMAMELSRENIQVNAISPGPVATAPLLAQEQANPAEARERRSYLPVGRLGEPDEIAEVAAMLLTLKGGFLVGHDLVVDGGFSIH